MDDQPPAVQPPLDLPDDGAPGAPWWRWPLVTVVAALPIVMAAAGVRLSCDSAVLNVALCGTRYADEAPAPAEVAVDTNETTIALPDPDVAGAAPVVVAREPSREFAGQFAKFVVVAPDGRQAIYVTAPDLSMAGARLWLVDAGQPKRLLKQFGDEFWIARPLWCQARPGDAGTIAYVTRGSVGPDQTGLELWTIGAAGGGDRRVLSGSPANGFRPELFYGEQRTPMRFLTGCGRIEYRDRDGETRVIDLATAQVIEPVTVPGVPVVATPPPSVPDAPPPGAPAVPGKPAAVPGAPGSPGGSGTVSPACVLQPLAQTDPRWSGNVMRPAGTSIGAEGCALTSTAMVFNFYGASTDPAKLNACAANQANGLHWDPVRARCSAERVQSTIWRDHATLRDLEVALAGGRPVIVGFDRPSNSHFVVVTGGFGDQLENYRVVDSWDGSTFQSLADFVSPKKGYHLRWLVVFNGPMPDCGAVVAPSAGLAPASGNAASLPVTFASPNNGGVYNKAVEVRYLAPPGAAVTTSHPDGATIDAEGAHTVTVRADGVPYRVSFIVDRTPPAVVGAWKPLDLTSGELAIDATDNLTYVTEAEYQIDDGPWQPFGPVTEEQAGVAFRPAMVSPLPAGARVLRYRATDSAGNQSEMAALDLQTGAATSPLPSPTATSTPAATSTPPPPPTLTPGPTATPTEPPPPTATVTPTEKPRDEKNDDASDEKSDEGADTAKATPVAPSPAAAVVRTPTAPPTATPVPTATVTVTPTGTATIVSTETVVPPTPTAEAPATAAVPDTPEAPAPAKTPDAPEAPAPTKSTDKPDAPKKDPPKKDEPKKDNPDAPRK